MELDTVIHGDSLEALKTLPKDCVDLCVTSPPYNVDLKGYDSYKDLKGHKEYLDWITEIFQTIHDGPLVSGGRVCLSGDTLVSTKGGFKKIKDIKIGEEVLTHKGRWRKVTHLMVNEYDRYYKLQAENSETVNITGNHPVFSVKTTPCPYRVEFNYICRNNCKYKENVRRGKNRKNKLKCKYLFYQNYAPTFIPVEGLNISDLVMMPIPEYMTGKGQMSKEDCLISGLYLSEGWLCDKVKKNAIRPRATQACFAFHKKEKPIHKALKGALAKKGVVCGKDYLRDNCLTINVYNTKFSRTLSKFGRGARNKTIPMMSEVSTKCLLNIVIAIWLGDGSIVRVKNNAKTHYGNKISISTTSSKLALQIRDILYINGYYPVVGYLAEKDSFFINLYGGDANTFYRVAKDTYGIDMYGYKDDWKGTARKLYRDVVPGYASYKIKKLGRVSSDTPMKFYNIEVEEDESYCLANFAVHNCINIGNGKNGKVPTQSDITQRMLNIGYLPMATIIWNKRNTSNRTAWGSFKSPSSPTFPTSFEYIMLFAKETYKLQTKGKTDLTRDEYVNWSMALWTPSRQSYKDSSKKINTRLHPAPFPEEIPHRLIKMLSWVGATVLDPFCGSGTALVAAKKLERHYIGIDMSERYCKYSRRRLAETLAVTNLFAK